MMDLQKVYELESTLKVVSIYDRPQKRPAARARQLSRKDQDPGSESSSFTWQIIEFKKEKN